MKKSYPLQVPDEEWPALQQSASRDHAGNPAPASRRGSDGGPNTDSLFQSNTSIKSSLTFLRKTPWARKKVEAWCIQGAK